MSFAWILSPALFYSIYAYIRLNFLNIKSFGSAKDVFRGVTSSAPNAQSALYLYFVLISALMFLTLSPYTLYNVLISQFTPLKPTLLVSLLYIVGYLVVKSATVSETSQFTPIATLLLFISAAALSVENLVQLYVLLEVVAYTNLLFLSLQHVEGVGNKRHNIVALVISFILNFLASILLFVSFTAIMWGWSYLTWWVFEFTNQTFLESTMLCTAVLVKLGVGPWLAGNYQTYVGYKLNYLLVYTVVSVVAILPILVSLLVHTGSPIVLLSVISVVFYITQTQSSITSLKGLFAYSTVIFHMYLLLIIL